jgi:predicted nucleotidyltransferase
MQRTDDVAGQLRAGAHEAFAGTPVIFAYLFGSHARGAARGGSDVDVAVSCDPLGDADARLRLRLELAGRLERTTRAGSG